MPVLPHLDALRRKAAALPDSPGVYLYKDAAGKVIYVGKAKSLRDRVRCYFLDDSLADTKTGTLMSEAAGLDYILLDNEKEADRKSTRLNSSHIQKSRMPSSA